MDRIEMADAPGYPFKGFSVVLSPRMACKASDGKHPAWAVRYLDRAMFAWSRKAGRLYDPDAWYWTVVERPSGDGDLWMWWRVSGYRATREGRKARRSAVERRPFEAGQWATEA